VRGSERHGVSPKATGEPPDLIKSALDSDQRIVAHAKNIPAICIARIEVGGPAQGGDAPADGVRMTVRIMESTQRVDGLPNRHVKKSQKRNKYQE